MSHPQREDWAPYLYGEATPDVQRNLREHLKQCPDCRRQFEAMKRTTERLSAWKLPRSRPLVETFMPLLKWAAVGCAVLLAGFAAGKVAAKPDAAGLRTELRAELTQELRQEFRQEMARAIRTEVDKASTATLMAANDHADKMASLYSQTLYMALKKDVDTLALNADAGLRRTAQQLVQLANYQDLPGNKESQQ